MKKCTRCKKEKTLDEFYKNRKKPGTYLCQCKRCHYEHAKKWRLANPDKARETVRRSSKKHYAKRRAYQLEYNKKNRDKIRQTEREYYWKNKEKIDEKNRKRFLLQLYGITVEQYDDILKSQNGGCKICGKQCKSGRKLAVDHDHKTKKVRGILCMNCNKGIGHFLDDPILLKKALTYLEDSNV